MTKVKTVADLVHDRRNPRKHNERNLKVIVDSLYDVGFARSIVIDENNEILAGNGVTEAAVLAGIEKVVEVEADGNTIIAVRRTGLSDEQKQRLKYFDNRSGELAGWDAEVLLADLQSGVDLSSMFNQDELDALLDGLVEKEPVQDAGATANATEARKTLAERFIIPPFSILDARQGYWQERKRAWIALGIQSELGRGDTGANTPHLGNAAADGLIALRNQQKAERVNKASPGGSPRPAATLGKDGRTIRGDGKGKPLGGGKPVSMAMHNDPMQRKRKYDG